MFIYIQIFTIKRLNQQNKMFLVYITILFIINEFNLQVQSLKKETTRRTKQW